MRSPRPFRTVPIDGAVQVGCGFKAIRGIRLRAKDIDFEQDQVMVRESQAIKDRPTMLPIHLHTLLMDQRGKVKLRDTDMLTRRKRWISCFIFAIFQHRRQGKTRIIRP
jgi:hypothetical protein